MEREAARRRQTVPTQLAAMAAGVRESTIRKWASRGKLVRYGSPGRAEYDLAELMAIVAGGAADDVGDEGPA
ncbi:MerR family transcriptional regulator [Amycolatopsis sp. SID8362]|uniref:MerR family transcriptional regulator n=1 Tax=Amycolatopsis sp. SID8362 TaxID=2690346 RepID=UPI0013688BE4|nr:MerR family transcriptional regulator [Amycolatopsis sp. SID8362]NBH12112.1 MerR family transcriptional regulator [Amycolatopsis sp. SID8362]NED48804.1 MerR family transcriptional regulator [Amycolatopsis sp. SID8362]